MHIYAHTKKTCSSCKQPHICPAVLRLNKSKTPNVGFKIQLWRNYHIVAIIFYISKNIFLVLVIYISTFYSPVSSREALSFFWSISYLIKQHESKHKTQRYEKYCSRPIKTNSKIYEDVKYMKLHLKTRKKILSIFILSL